MHSLCDPLGTKSTHRFLVSEPNPTPLAFAFALSHLRRPTARLRRSCLSALSDPPSTVALQTAGTVGLSSQAPQLLRPPLTETPDFEQLGRAPRRIQRALAAATFHS